jgi:hypothetical protein
VQSPDPVFPVKLVTLDPLTLEDFFARVRAQLNELIPLASSAVKYRLQAFLSEVIRVQKNVTVNQETKP